MRAILLLVADGAAVSRVGSWWRIRAAWTARCQRDDCGDHCCSAACPRHGPCNCRDRPRGWLARRSPFYPGGSDPAADLRGAGV